MLEPLGHAMKTDMTSYRQAGASLIEVLVGLAIGLVILTAIGTVYVNSNNLMRQREDQAQLNDPARVVMGLLRQNLMQAGYVDIFDLDAASRAQAATLFVPGNDNLTNVFVRDPAVGAVGTPLGQFFPGLTPIFGCDGDMNDTPNDIVTLGPQFPPLAPLAQTCGAANATRHTLRIAYQAAPISAANPTTSLVAGSATVADGLDCLQQDPVAGSPMVINQFSLRMTNGVMQLACRGSGGAAIQDIAPGVEEFVLRYQMAAPGLAANRQAAGGGQAQYINATQVTASAQGWAGVTAVEVCMISATDQTRGPAAPGTVQLQTTRPTCARDANGVYLPNIARVAGDTRLWKRFTSVVSLRNAVFATPL